MKEKCDMHSRMCMLFLCVCCFSLLSARTFEITDTTAIIDTAAITDTTAITIAPTGETETFCHEDHTHDFHWEQFAIPAATLTVSGLFVSVPKLVQAREWVQDQLANKTGQPRTAVDDYIQYAPMVAPYLLYLCGVKGEHNLIDKTIILAMSYATFAIVNRTMKFAIDEQRPNSEAMNSFPSGHTGTAFVGAEFLRREYWHTNKWIGIAGYACAVAVAYLRVYNNRHWINDVIGGAALGYMSTAFAYWLYPKIFRKRAERHREELLRRNTSSMTCFAVPYASTNSVGVSCLISF